MSDLPETYTCEECHETSPARDWRLTSVDCETCGDHTAIQCPRCLEVIDLVFTDHDYPGYMDLEEGYRYDRLRG